jgi:ActR/RegA family two-component response regulator
MPLPIASAVPAEFPAVSPTSGPLGDPKSRCPPIHRGANVMVPGGSSRRLGVTRIRTVLIVDDSEVTRAALASRLTQQGASVVCAGSVEDALAVDALVITAAIVDVDLGRGDDGVSLADALADRNPRMRLALFTGHDEPAGAGARTTFRKPDEVDRVVAWALEDS